MPTSDYFSLILPLQGEASGGTLFLGGNVQVAVLLKEGMR